MFYIKMVIALFIAFIDWKILDHLLYCSNKINEKEKFYLFIGTCILLAAFVIGR